MKFLLFLFLLFPIEAKSDSLKDVSVIPKNIGDFISAKGCNQIKNFYSIFEDVRNPPYVYGLFGSVGLSEVNKLNDSLDLFFIQNSFAVWCEIPEDGDAKYFLALNTGSNNFGAGACPKFLGPYEDIGGLQIIEGAVEPLNWYRQSKTGQKIHSKEYTSGPILESIYDGMGYRFYCNNGVWVERDMH